MAVAARDRVASAAPFSSCHTGRRARGRRPFPFTTSLSIWPAGEFIARSAHGGTFWAEESIMALGLKRAVGLVSVAAAALLLAGGCGDEASQLDTNIYELSPSEEANIDVATRVIEQGLGGGDA